MTTLWVVFHKVRGRGADIEAGFQETAEMEEFMAEKYPQFQPVDSGEDGAGYGRILYRKWRNPDTGDAMYGQGVPIPNGISRKMGF